MDRSANKLTINAISATVQVAFTAIVYFLLYRYLLDKLGVDQLGIWSLILSFSSIANLANLGLTSGSVKFVAEYLAENKIDKIGKLIMTSIISLAVLFSVVSLLILILSKYFLHFFVETAFLEIAFSILPFSLVSLCISAISGVFTSVLEGYQKNYLRNFLYILSGIVLFVFSLILIDNYGLKGVAIAQLFQSLSILIFSIILVLRLNPMTTIKNWKWSKSTFKEIFNYGYKFQVVSVFQLLYEPTTKMLLGKFGGLTLLGHYEMASRMINQFRGLLVGANQVVIPVVAENAKMKTKEESARFYVSTSGTLTFFTIPFSTLLVALVPIISYLWIGNVQPEFCNSAYFLIAASVINILSGPAYFSCMGEGKLNLLIFEHTAMAVLNILFALGLYHFIGGYGIILGWSLALSISSIALLLVYNRVIGIKFTELFSKNDRSILYLGISLFIIMVIIQIGIGENLGILFTTVVCVLIHIFYIPFLYKNKLLVSKLKMALKNNTD